MAKSARDEVMEVDLEPNCKCQAVRFGAEGTGPDLADSLTSEMERFKGCDQYTTIVRSKPSQMVLNHPKWRRQQG